MKVAITGSSGFVGQNLQKYLSFGHHTDLKLISRSVLENVSISALEDIDVVVHLAGKAHDLKSVSDPEEYYRVNFELTKHLFDAFLKSKASKFIFISSVKAAADIVENVLLEEDKAVPETHYGKSKLLAEEYILSQSLPEGKSIYILRPCMIHGPGNKGNLNLLYSFVKKGIPYPLAAFENKRSFLSVENLCFVITEIIDRADINGGIYNVSDDMPLSTNEVVSCLSDASGKKAKLWALPKGLLIFLSRIGDRLKLPLNSERLSKLTENYIVSNSKLKLALHKELPLSSRQGIMNTAKSFSEQ
ncbi:nucleoside-diphosphate-sugar epimerase [Pedobacter sp. HMWF019]|uniref:NAD-dependent epimerase/dehydratase family protein n=1 Tax=Pedobacter sp. HMWF019 TaxID=2056856 RepID=UPI000D383774|nr:NAD-dependent epimerase/dehydratase family protein [Pedobacter sp. HMWF019]PTS95969.1 nucleoside-diphosphate-sugar epimerase [Pedobacter sp. HMWF019]